MILSVVCLLFTHLRANVNVFSGFLYSNFVFFLNFHSSMLNV